MLFSRVMAGSLEEAQFMRRLPALVRLLSAEVVSRIACERGMCAGFVLLRRLFGRLVLWDRHMSSSGL